MKTKTARFTQVVAKCGRPLVHDQWVAPEKDATLKKAVKESRVLTVHIHTVGAQKDHGEVGLVKKGNKQHVLLIFPKSLRAFAEKRVVGINYDLLKESAGKATKKPKPVKAEMPTIEPKSKGAESEEMLRLFRPDDQKEEKAKPPRKKPPSPAKPAKTQTQRGSSADSVALRRQIKKAMKELQSGKAVMAYHTLEKSLT